MSSNWPTGATWRRRASNPDASKPLRTGPSRSSCTASMTKPSRFWNSSRAVRAPRRLPSRTAAVTCCATQRIGWAKRSGLPGSSHARDRPRRERTASTCSGFRICSWKWTGKWMTPGSVRDARQVLGGLVPFFAPGGRFETLLERVHGSARDVVRRVHRHVENVRARNIRIETLRDRTREMARLAEEELDVANAWINGLFASAHVVTDLRCGTPVERSALPRPARRYETRRAAHRGGYLAEKRGSPGQARALERLRLLVLGRFVDEKILRGAPQAALEAAAFDRVEDFRSLVDAVKAHALRAGRARGLLSYRIGKPSQDTSPRARARFVLPGGTLDAPNLMCTSARSGGRRD